MCVPALYANLLLVGVASATAVQPLAALRGFTTGQRPSSAAGNEKAVQFLIRFQADIEAESSTGEPPLKL